MRTSFNPVLDDVIDFAMVGGTDDLHMSPNSFQEVWYYPELSERESWREAIRKEINHMISNKVWRKIQKKISRKIDVCWEVSGFFSERRAKFSERD